MIEFIRGKIISKEATRVVIDVGGVGMGMDLSLRTGEKLSAVGDSIEIVTYLHVREDALELYGFGTMSEKQLFLKLLSVSGIGPKLALRILSSVSPQQLSDMILRGDVGGLTGLKGVGKKTAEVLIATLRTSISKMDLSSPADATTVKEPLETSSYRDAVRALIALGVKDTQAQESVRKALQKLGEGAITSRLIAQALQEG